MLGEEIQKTLPTGVIKIRTLPTGVIKLNTKTNMDRNQKEILITNIFGGISPTLNFGEEGSYIGSCAIDPDVKVNGRISGTISPTSYEQFDELKDVLWFEPNDKDTDTYFYTQDGSFGKIDENKNVEIIDTLYGSGNGLKYYNNYYYIAVDDDVHRYGPIDGTPSMEENWFSGLASENIIYQKYLANGAVPIINGYSGGEIYDIAAQPISSSNLVNATKIEFLVNGMAKVSASPTLKISFMTNSDSAPGAVFSRYIDGAFRYSYVEIPFVSGIQTITIDEGTNDGYLLQLLQEQFESTPGTYWIQFEVTNSGTENNDAWAVYVGTETGSSVIKTRRYEDSSWGEWTPYTVGSSSFSLSMKVTGKELNIGRPLSDKELPTISGYNIPNHSIFLHGDNSLYVCDNLLQNGTINKIKTVSKLTLDSIYDRDKFLIGEQVKGETSGTTADIMGFAGDFSMSAYEQEVYVINVSGDFEEGETVTGTTQGEGTVVKFEEGIQDIATEPSVLNLKEGYMPVCMTNYGTDLVIGAIGTEDSKLFFWDTFSTSFYREIKIPYRYITSLVNYNGELYFIGGNDNFSICKYLGGETVQEIFHCDHGALPLPGSVKINNNQILIGSSQTFPEERGCVWSWGLKATMPDRLHNIISNPEYISAIALDNEDLITSSDGLYKKTDEVYDSIFCSRVFNFSQPFTINKITIPFSTLLNDDSGEYPTETEVSVILHYDNDRITDTHIAELDDDGRSFSIYPIHHGTTNFYIEFKIIGDKFVSINLPIRIIYTLDE